MKNTFSDKNYWLKLLKLDAKEIPSTLMVYGSWFSSKILTVLEKSIIRQKETGLPNLYLGKYKDTNLLYGVIFGPTMAGTLCHLAGTLKLDRVILIGSCGGLNSKPTSINIPSLAKREDSVSDWYLKKDVTPKASPKLINMACSYLQRKNIEVDTGITLTISHMLMESSEDIKRWHKAGISGVDLETATVLSIANYFKIDSLSILVKAEQLSGGKVLNIDKNERVRIRDEVIKCALTLLK